MKGPNVTTKQENDEIRQLRYQLKRANATMGKQGQTIHNLRAELAETRELHSKIERGDLRRLERREGEYHETIDKLREELHEVAVKFSEELAENKKLREKLEDAPVLADIAEESTHA